MNKRNMFFATIAIAIVVFGIFLAGCKDPRNPESIPPGSLPADPRDSRCELPAYDAGEKIAEECLAKGGDKEFCMALCITACDELGKVCWKNQYGIVDGSKVVSCREGCQMAVGEAHGLKRNREQCESDSECTSGNCAEVYSSDGEHYLYSMCWDKSCRRLISHGGVRFICDSYHSGSHGGDKVAYPEGEEELVRTCDSLSEETFNQYAAYYVAQYFSEDEREQALEAFSYDSLCRQESVEATAEE